MEMRRSTLIGCFKALFCVFLLVLSRSHALSFYLFNGEQRCLLAMLPIHSTGIGEYSVSGSYGVMHVNLQVFRVVDEQVLFHQERITTGTFSFDVDEPPGSLASPSPRNVQVVEASALGLRHAPLTTSFDQDVKISLCVKGYRTGASASTAAKRFVSVELEGHLITNTKNSLREGERLDKVGEGLARIEDELAQLVIQIDRANSRANHLRELGERTKHRIVWTSILAFVVLIVTGLLQVLHLKKYFQKFTNPRRSSRNSGFSFKNRYAYA
uniref:GOLD domain-containing protein n=1 Tax=Timspurckia oligopyrenoides TaxID=708627 RepID=A0A7S0ZJS7_9RHOD|mmetsp:Transcript_8062/g.14613  ORF Transcript_8062/g.14613 Transcript_8062/m.14613 type:complete len:270 (+) Transcript_8062:67-876(+)